MAEGGVNKTYRLSTRSMGSDFIFDFYCELCNDDGKNVEAEGFCVDCGEYLCRVCYTSHQRTRQTRQHQLLDKDSMPKDTPLSPDRISKFITTECIRHAGELVKYYCKTHDVLGCNTCFVTDHRSCPEVKPITKQSENIMESQEYTDLIMTLNSLDNKSRDIIANARAYTTKAKKCHSEVIKSVKLLRDKVIDILDKLEREIVAEADAKLSEEEMKMATISNNCSMTLNSLQPILAEFQTLQSSKRVCQLYITMKEKTDHIKALQDKIRVLEEALALRTFKFEPNRTFQDIIENPPTLGMVSSKVQRITETLQTEVNKPVVPRRGQIDHGEYIRAVRRLNERQQNQDNTPVSEKSPPSLGENSSEPQMITERQHNKPAPKNIMHVTDICIEHDYMDYSIIGSAVLSHTRLVTVQNESIRLIDPRTNKLKSELTVKGEPLDVTEISSKKAAVTLCFYQKILFLNVADDLERDREITVDGVCRGVAYSKDRLVVTYVRPPKLEIMDLSGNVMASIVNDSSGNQMFQKPHYVCVSKDGQTIYVSDQSSNKVTSLTFDGVVKSVYTDRELINPRGVCVDRHGNVYVCGNRSKNVHMLTADLAKIKIILTQSDGLNEGVMSLSRCQEKNRLYIGKYGKVKVFQLS